MKSQIKKHDILFDKKGEYVVIAFPDYELSEDMKDKDQFKGEVSITFYGGEQKTYESVFEIQKETKTIAMKTIPKRLVGIIYCDKKSKDFMNSEYSIGLTEKVSGLRLLDIGENCNV